MCIKYARKLSFLILWLLHVHFLGGNRDTDLCEPLRSIRLNSKLMTKLDTMHILQAQVRVCISAHPGLPHQKTKRETSDAAKSQLNQAS